MLHSKRRRSTVRADIDQSFETSEVKESVFEGAYKNAADAEIKGSIDLSPKGKSKSKSGLKEL